MYSTGGLRRNGIIKSYNVEKEKGWLRYKEGTEFKEVSFNKENIKEGFPTKDDSITFTLIANKVSEVWVKEATSNVIQLIPNSEISHVLTVYHPNIYNKENVILNHALKLEEIKKTAKDGYIYWGKIVEASGKPTPGINAEWAAKINAEIEKNKVLKKVVKLIITDFHEVYIAPLLKVHYNSPLTEGLEKYKKMPEYYTKLKEANRPCEVFFEINDFFKIERDSLLNNLQYRDTSGEIRRFSPYESNMTYPIQVIDEHYMFDDGNNFDPEFISNKDGAHFYDITSNERSHDEEMVSNICMNLMDAETWARLPSLARTYIIEAEEGFYRANEKFNNRSDSQVLGFRICMSYLNAIEAILKDPAGRGKLEDKVPYLSFRAEYLKRFPEKRETHLDYVIRDFFSELAMVSATTYSSIRKFKGDKTFENVLEKNNRIMNLNSFIKELYEMRNIEAHSTTLPPYEFFKLKNIRNTFWGINTLASINNNSSGLAIINLLLKLYGIYDKKNKWMKEAA
jgi:hypothetical protein